MHRHDEDLEIPEEVRSLISDAKRHHYVPEFLLRRFSIDPHDEHPQNYRLDVTTGTIATSSTRDCAVIQHYNRLSDASGLPPGFVEALLSYAEGMAAPVIDKLVLGETVNEQERGALSFFIMIQQQRTPRGREWQRFGQEQAAKFWLLKQLYENHELTREHLRQSLGREPTEAEVTEWIREMAAPLENGELMVAASSDHEILGMFLAADTMMPLIYDLNWTLLRAPEGQSFILSDDPLVRHDPANPNGPAGWRSSPTVEVTLPLDPHLCLLLRQSPPRTQEEVVIDPAQVLDINLRTYAGAREAIFGPTQELVQSIRVAAQGNVARVDRYRPKPPNIHLLEREMGANGRSG